jgi:flagellum-specific peptidoglycan hydrolase FlgJ
MQPTPDVIAAAQAAARKWRVPASVSLAQWALESSWGRHMPEGSNNPFGIKARLNPNNIPIDPYVDADTSEVLGKQVVHITAPFRKFASLADAFDYHADLLATAHVYANAMAVKAKPDAFAQALTGRYATDPGYGRKLIQVMQGSNLYQYDVSTEGPQPPALAKAA